ncbi:MAG: hypothetical protein MR021_02420 [Clostridiales bacterium]|nr:hypothetical protein [Clostridiales bacterium]
MKCPHCGRWNRDTFPRCFSCGAELPRPGEGTEKSWQEAMRQEKPQKSYVRVDDLGNATPANDARDHLAREMNRLQERKEQGKLRQQAMREESVRQGLAPSGRTVENWAGNSSLYAQAQNTRYVADDAAQVEGDIRPGATQVTSRRLAAEEDWLPEDEGAAYAQQRRGRRAPAAPPPRPLRIARGLGSRRIVKIAIVLLLLAAVLCAAYTFVYKPLVLDQKQPPLQERVEISPSIYDDKPAHTIKIPGQEGAVIYIKELRKSYTVTGGYAVLDVPDYTWYEDTDVGDQAQITATITPYLKTSAGEQVPLEVFTFQVDVPLSPLTLISPDTGYAQVSTAIYNIQFQVEKNSTVYINGENYSDLVNTQDGLISYNASVLPIGNNEFKITTKAQYYRENSATVTIYRAVQDIPLDLATTLGNRSLKQTMTISATTLPGATITINSPYVSLDTSSLGSTGVFSFEAYFPKIGTNTVSITASYPGKRDSVVDYDVYYVPDATTYTAKAWPLYKASEYAELLSNMSLRIEKSQVYECTGEIIEIKATSPQLAVMEMGTGDTSRQVLLENRSTDTWVVGQRYRVYADVCGLYDSMPRLVGRYTYAPRN